MATYPSRSDDRRSAHWAVIAGRFKLVNKSPAPFEDNEDGLDMNQYIGSTVQK